MLYIMMMYKQSLNDKNCNYYYISVSKYEEDIVYEKWGEIFER